MVLGKAYLGLYSVIQIEFSVDIKINLNISVRLYSRYLQLHQKNALKLEYSGGCWILKQIHFCFAMIGSEHMHSRG